MKSWLICALVLESGVAWGAGASLALPEGTDADTRDWWAKTAVTPGTRDLQRGARFYDAIARELGVGRMMETERYIARGKPGGAAGG